MERNARGQPAIHLTSSPASGAAWRPEGEWIASLDLVEQGDKLVVKEMGQLGNCGSECKTVQLAAERIMGEHDTDIAETLFVVRAGRDVDGDSSALPAHARAQLVLDPRLLSRVG